MVETKPDSKSDDKAAPKKPKGPVTMVNNGPSWDANSSLNIGPWRNGEKKTFKASEVDAVKRAYGAHVKVVK